MEYNKFYYWHGRSMAGRTFPAPVEEILRLLSSDRTSGASSLVGLAASAFSALAASTVSTGSRALAGEAEDLCRDIVAVQPFMAPLYNLCARVLPHADQKLPLPNMKRGIARAAAHHADGSAAGLERASAQAAKLVLDGGRVLTLSSSAAVLRSLELANQDRKRFSVVVLESRPMLEGRAAAAGLAAAGIGAELTVDAALVTEVRRAGQVLVGADALTDEVLVNKCGTLALALVAKEYGVPVLAVAEDSKLLPNVLLPENDRVRDPREVWDGAPPGVTVRNRYFEKVPLKYVKTFVLEDGPGDARAVGRRLETPGPGMAALERLLRPGP
jgi:translation initiation factor 2B subunit (eIF-2B alpha/beta/delta family)